MEFFYSDGGRFTAGFKGHTGDCVIRAIAIATETPYEQVYKEMEKENRTYMLSYNNKVAKKLQQRGTTPRNGNYREVYELYLAKKGWLFKPTMSIGSGCKVHMRADELPGGSIIVRLSRHIAAVVDGVVFDTSDPSREGKRCVYGYYQKVK